MLNTFCSNSGECHHWDENKVFVLKNFIQLRHLARIFRGIPTTLLKALTTCMESVSKQIWGNCSSMAFSIAIMRAQNSASKAKVWPILLEMAPRKAVLESLITMPTAPQGWAPMADPSQLNFTTFLGGGHH